MEATAHAQAASTGSIYSRRQSEKTALYQVVQQYLLTLFAAGSGDTAI
jgi:hypothetical protein